MDWPRMTSIGRKGGMSPGLVPIAVFAYNRPKHLQRLADSLDRVPGFRESPLYIFCDGPRTEADRPLTDAVRRIAQDAFPVHAERIWQSHNLGLAQSLISGITAVLKRHGRIIVAEDDLVFSPVSLAYFHEALERYADTPRVAHVAGYMFPTGRHFTRPFFYREMSCWGWATWTRAWRLFEPNAAELLARIDREGRASAFDLDGTMAFREMLRNQRDGVIDSWAIRWYASMFCAGALALHPPRPVVANLGFDGTGSHCRDQDARFAVTLTHEPITDFPNEINECEDAVAAMMQYRREWTRPHPTKAPAEQ